MVGWFLHYKGGHIQCKSNFHPRLLLFQEAIATQRLDIAALPNGLYLLTSVTPSGKIFSGKFRKQE